MKHKIFLNNIYRAASVFILSAFLCVSLAGCSESGSTIVPGSSILPAPSKSITEVPTTLNSDEIGIEGVLSSVDTESKKMRFIEISTGTEYEVPYTGGTDIQTKYGTVIAVSNMELGEIYEVKCSDNGTAVSIYGAKDAWERTGIEGLSFDESTRKITVGSAGFVYDSNALILSGGEKISIARIVKQDKVTLRGIDSTVYSITVEAGHGYIKFTGVDAFEGGYASIGRSQLMGVTSDMLVTAQEGTYTIELQASGLTGSKTVTVEKGKETQVDFSEYSLPATKQGTVNFKITPQNVIMTIDGEEVDYSSPVQLAYGRHTLTLKANHYEEYTETFVVNSPYYTKVIDMTAKSSSTSGTTASELTSGYSVSVTAPEGAALYVDSVYVGIIPCSFEKKAGNKTITLTKNGYNTISYTISIANSSGNLNYAFPDMVETNGSATEEETTR